MMIRHKIDFTFMAFKHFKTSDAHGQPSPDNFTPHVPKGPFTLERFLRKNFVVPCLTVVISRRCLGGIRPNTLKRRNDYYMWYGLIKYIERNNMKWVGMTELGGYHRIHTGSLTSSRIKSVFHQYLFYKHCGFGFKERARYMLSYLCNTIGSR